MGASTRRRILWVVVAALALVFGVVMGARAQATSFCGDTIEGTGGADELDGDRFGPCFDRISGKDGNDVIRGLSLRDTVYGGDGPDELYGGTGRDRMYGGGGADTLYGGRGDDRITTDLDAAKDFVDCGPGRDTVHLSPDPPEQPDTYRNCEMGVVGTG